MKILIKIHINENLNLKDFESKIFNKSKTKLLFSDDINTSIPNSINSNLSEIPWDIIIPIYKPFIPINNFDDKIREIYKEKFPKFEGVLWINDGEQKDICTIPVIGKNYYKEFGYVYNPSYEKYNFEKEFTDILKLKNKFHFIENILFEKKIIIHDDYKIYEFRKRFNFGLTDTTDEKEILNIEPIIESTQIEPPFQTEETNEPSSILNKFVDNVYVINLERRPDRLEHTNKEFNRYNIHFERFNAIDGSVLNNAQLACLRSHRGVIMDAIEKDYEKIAVFEDDNILCDDFEERFQYFSENVPEGWEIMYLGCNLNQCKFPPQVKTYIHKINKAFGCFAMILNNKNGLFQRILDITSEETKAIDNYFHDDILDMSNAYMFYPFFVKTLYTESDISGHNKKMSYDIVDRFFKPRVKLPIKKETITQPVEINQPREYVRSNKDICEEYLRGRKPFQIFYENRLIFDSSISDKINVVFFDDYFTIYGKMFRYQGMRIKMK